MASSDEKDRAVAGSGDDGEPGLLRCLDYPCTRRLRLRRLLAYHRRYTQEEIYETMKKKMRLVFDMRELVKHVKSGQWRVASSYFLGFLNSDPMSYEAKLLLMFLQYLMGICEFAEEGNYIVTVVVSNWFKRIYKESVLAEYPCFATLVADVLFLRSDHARAFLNWRLVRNKAAEMVERMVYKTPELKDKLRFPRGPNNLCHVVPIGSSFHRRRHAKIVRNKQSTDYVQFYLKMKKRLPSPSHGASSDYSGLSSGDPLMALLEEALQAGTNPMLKQSRTAEYSSLKYLSVEDIPLLKMLSEPLFLTNPMDREVHQSEYAPEDTTQNHAAAVSSGNNPGKFI